MKNKETLEEAAREYYKRGQLGFEKAADTEKAFFKGGIWQQQRMYSEEEVLKIIQECKSYLSFGDEFNEVEWFEQLKK